MTIEAWTSATFSPHWRSHSSELGIQRFRSPEHWKNQQEATDKDGEIAEEKARDMNAEDIESIKRMVAGTARSMGVQVEG